MAEDIVVCINALLCFALYSYKKHPSKFISSILTDFYPSEVISEAKEKLVMDIEALKLDKWLRPPSRRGDNKRKHDIEDILSQIALMDEGGHIARMPRYVVDNLDNIPLIRMERGEFAVIVSKLDKLSDDLAAHRCDVRALGGDGHCSDVTLNHRVTDLSSQVNIARQWGTESEVDSSDGAGAFTTVQRSKKKRKATTSPSGPLPSALTQDGVGDVMTFAEIAATAARPRLVPSRTGATTHDSRTAAGRGPASARVSAIRVIGKSTNPSGLQAAKPYVRKAVFAIYNVNNDESAGSLSDFIANTLEVCVLSCFETNLQKPSRYSKSFRVCINARDISNLLMPDKWADGIIIKKWRFAERGARSTLNSTSSVLRHAPGSSEVVGPTASGPVPPSTYADGSYSDSGLTSSSNTSNVASRGQVETACSGGLGAAGVDNNGGAMDQAEGGMDVDCTGVKI